MQAVVQSNGLQWKRCKVLRVCKLTEINNAQHSSLPAYSVVGCRSRPSPSSSVTAAMYGLLSACVVANVLFAWLGLTYLYIAKGVILEDCTSDGIVGVRDFASSVVLQLKALRYFLWIEGNAVIQ